MRSQIDVSQKPGEPDEPGGQGCASGSPSKVIYAVSRTGFHEEQTWKGLMVYLPEHWHRWFEGLSDLERVELLSLSAQAVRSRVDEREERIKDFCDPEASRRPSSIPGGWDSVLVWVPPSKAAFPALIQRLVSIGLGVQEGSS